MWYSAKSWLATCPNRTSRQLSSCNAIDNPMVMPPNSCELGDRRPGPGADVGGADRYDIAPVGTDPDRRGGPRQPCDREGRGGDAAAHKPASVSPGSWGGVPPLPPEATGAFPQAGHQL